MNVSEDINFLKLEKEFQSAINADEKYTRENDAKFRAVHQRVESYEQFRDMVAASHLTPLDRKDISMTEKPKQPWNTLYSADSRSSNTLENIPETKLHFTSIDTSDKLMKQWKLLKTHQERCNFLCQVSSPLQSILTTEIPMNFMEEVVLTFKCSIDADNASSIVHTMNLFTKSKRFRLSLQFLSKTDKEDIKDLFTMLEGMNLDISELKQCYNLG